MPRDSAVFLEDIAQACAKVARYTAAMTLDTFLQDDRTVDAVVRNLEIIGEAVKRLPEDIRSQIPGIDWKRVAGLRDLLIHQYFGVDLENRLGDLPGEGASARGSGVSFPVRAVAGPRRPRPYPRAGSERLGLIHRRFAAALVSPEGR
ncbi:MAG: hypothetical protein JWN02_2179 [Acidobacteria bacterium]|nr:hypothetical protein [Acidobacteriota bacterium]